MLRKGFNFFLVLNDIKWFGTGNIYFINCEAVYKA